MEVTYDPKKNAANIHKHGISFDDVYEFDFLTCRTIIDRRKDYGEVRYIATGYLHATRLHVLCYTETESGIRVISFRKANTRERKRYVKERES